MDKLDKTIGKILLIYVVTAAICLIAIIMERYAVLDSQPEKEIQEQKQSTLEKVEEFEDEGITLYYLANDKTYLVVRDTSSGSIAITPLK